MKTAPREWITFMREQYPEGSRVTLCEMKDPFDPVEPGSTGRLDRIDDAGTFHVNWDNGRTLGLIVGEDRFSIRPPAPALLRLYMPMTADCYMQNEWGDLENEPNALDSREAARYADSIAAALGREFHPEEAERGLMKYYRADDGVNRRVQSLRFSAEVRGGRRGQLRDHLPGEHGAQLEGLVIGAEGGAHRHILQGLPDPDHPRTDAAGAGIAKRAATMLRQ